LPTLRLAVKPTRTVSPAPTPGGTRAACKQARDALPGDGPRLPAEKSALVFRVTSPLAIESRSPASLAAGNRSSGRRCGSALRRTDACVPWPAAPPRRGGRREWPCARESRGGACG
jgi:hypothetical protein